MLFFGVLLVLTISAQSTDIEGLMVIGKNTEYVIELKEGKKIRIAKKAGWIETGEYKSRLLHLGKHRKDKVRKIFMDDETGQIFIRFKKTGKVSLNELQLLGVSQKKSTIVGGVIDMFAVAGMSTSLILADFVLTGTGRTIAWISGGVSGAAFVFFGVYAYLGDVYLYDMPNADLLYRPEGAKGYKVYRYNPKSTGTFSYPKISIK